MQIHAPANYVVIEIQQNNQLKTKNLDLIISTQYNPEEWETNFGTLVGVASTLTTSKHHDYIAILGTQKISFSELQETLDKLHVGNKVYFHSSDVFMGCDDRNLKGNAFIHEDKMYVRLRIDRIFATEIKGEFVNLSGWEFVEPIVNDEVMSSSGNLFIPEAFRPKDKLQRGKLNGYTVFFSKSRQIKKHPLNSKDYYVIHNSQINAIELEDGTIEPLNHCVFVEPTTKDKIGTIILPEAYKRELQKLIDRTDLYEGVITHASKQATLYLRRIGIKSAVIGTTVLLGSGISFEMEVNGKLVWICNVVGMSSDTSIYAYKLNNQ